MLHARHHRFALLFALLPLTAPLPAAEPKPSAFFILAGQSNMEGHARVETFDYIGDDPATAPLLKTMRSADGQPTVCEHCWISYFTGSGDNNGEGHGRLTAGYGSRQKPITQRQDRPEFTFGLAMDAAFDEPRASSRPPGVARACTPTPPPVPGRTSLNDEQLKRFPAREEGH